jgi:tetratricopeptide (TPR) repeat protein
MAAERLMSDTDGATPSAHRRPTMSQSVRWRSEVSLLRALLVLAVLCAPLQPRISRAMEFYPSEAEWQVWPEYCRARYVVSGAGRESAFASRISQNEVQRWQSSIGSEAWYALHHYCGGLTWMDRADKRPEKALRQSELGIAIDEFNFYLQRTPPEHPVYAEAQVRVCICRERLGDIEDALRACDLAIRAQPANPIGYSAKAMVLRRHKKADEARLVLEEGNRRTAGQSAELQYFLGLISFDSKEYPKAVEYARKAYALGYPLPGLRNKLQAAGYKL